MDTPSIPEGQPSLGSLLGSGAGRTGKRDRPFLDVGWEQHKGESCPQLSHKVRTVTPVQPGFHPAPARHRPQALIMFAGCLQYECQCPESP